MNFHTSYNLAEQRRNEMLDHAAQTRLARTARKSNTSVLRTFTARFARPAAQPVVVQIDTFPVPSNRSAAA
jgi:hypothetical protein